jgi:hypothetical protein
VSTPNPARHPAHERPLPDRIVIEAVRSWLDTATATAASFDPINDHERGALAAIKEMRSLHLSGFEHSLVPEILGQLRRAGLLATKGAA